MMFNFDECIDRCHSDSYKWKKYAGKDIIPLWIADTDFRSPPCISEALYARIKHGVFGYGTLPTALTDIFIERMYERYQWSIQAEWLIFLPGLVSGLHLAVRALTSTDEAIIIPCPIYPPFRMAARSVGRQQRIVPMRLISSRWCVDFSSINATMTGKETLLMLCNPHNPGGTAYRRDELEQHLDFAKKHNLLVCSDEIHCDLLLTPGLKHTPFASLNEDAAQRSITLMSPSKTFNIAGLGISVAIIPNTHLRMRFATARAGIVPVVNVFAVTAASAAWRSGQDWLTQQLNYLRGNRDRLAERLKEIPKLTLSGPEATYMAWIDASGLGAIDPHAFFENAGVGLSSGAEFGDNRFVRLNFGCTRALLEKALDRIALACATK